jgi:S-adenosylmethionine:tRNA ribosyltransferase-isomerase
VSDFDFDLPADLIAQEPAAERGGSRLLVLRRDSGSVEHTTFARIADFLRSGDVLVLNESKVLPARLLGRRVPSGGAVECLLLERQGSELWQALVHPGQKLKPGARLEFERNGMRLHGEILGAHFRGRRTVRLWSSGGEDVEAVSDAIGHIPLPPYIKRADTSADRERYQTVYARTRGSIAAPTAGLHMTTGILDSLAARGVEQVAITLHVGYGTFKPVTVERVEEHHVDAEAFDVGAAAAGAITRARREGRRIIAVGTTTVRALESLAVTPDGRAEPAAGTTALFIAPGHRFRWVDGLVTNFHLPRSSLLMLVAAFAGRERVLEAYREAIAHRYRFYSYGDAMLIL